MNSLECIRQWFITHVFCAFLVVDEKKWPYEHLRNLLVRAPVRPFSIWDGDFDWCVGPVPPQIFSPKMETFYNTPPPTFTQFHWPSRVNMRPRVTMTWPSIQAIVMEGGLTNWQLTTSLRLQDTQGVKDHPMWPDLELGLFFITLSSQPHAW